MIRLDKEEVKRILATFHGKGFHSIDLGYGLYTIPMKQGDGNRHRHFWKIVEKYVGQDLRGKTVLDIACNNGVYSLEFARRGAFVRGIDIHKEGHRMAKFVRAVYGLEERIDFVLMDLFDLPEKPQYDIVLMLAVIHHLWSKADGTGYTPEAYKGRQRKALDIASSRCREMLILESPKLEEWVPYLKEKWGDVIVEYPTRGGLDPDDSRPLYVCDRPIVICTKKRTR